MKTAAAITVTVALVLAIVTAPLSAAPARQTDDFGDHIGNYNFEVAIDGVNQIGDELQAKIQAAIADYERLPSWMPILPDSGLADMAVRLVDMLPTNVELSDLKMTISMADWKLIISAAAAAYMNARTVGEALDVLAAMDAAVAESAGAEHHDHWRDNA